MRCKQCRVQRQNIIFSSFIANFSVFSLFQLTKVIILNSRIKEWFDSYQQNDFLFFGVLSHLLLFRFFFLPFLCFVRACRNNEIDFNFVISSASQSSPLLTKTIETQAYKRRESEKKIKEKILFLFHLLIGIKVLMSTRQKRQKHWTKWRRERKNVNQQKPTKKSCDKNQRCRSWRTKKSGTRFGIEMTQFQQKEKEIEAKMTKKKMKNQTKEKWQEKKCWRWTWLRRMDDVAGKENRKNEIGKKQRKEN